ncbi:MAG: nicotinate phosphoribosyltransferase [Candidatus Omnitrophica bacterium]|nr:nicotinate phosphoribosyltransferase [Candidatus Omnitrophota bacterium]
MNVKKSLLLDLYELTMAQSYLEFKPDVQATFDLFVRNMPANRSYFVAAGLEDALNYLENLKFDQEAREYLKKQNLFSAKFLDYLKDFKFKGDCSALAEGTIFFAQEPVIRITANIIEAQIVESYLLNTINFQTLIATKAARIVSVARGREVFDFALRRTHGSDAALKVARAAYLAGFRGSSCVFAGMLYGIPITGTMAHSYVMSFKNELASFRAYAKIFPKRTVLLVDTYNCEEGIGNAIIVAKELEKKGFRLAGIRLDSGDIARLSKWARKRLDGDGLNYVKIFASGNLDEYKIEKLIKNGAKIDSFGVGTNMGVSSDAPYLDGIYKISEVSDTNGAFLPKMKLSRGKVTHPGRKQVYRIRDKEGNYLKDILGLENEHLPGEPLLVKVMEKGKIIYKKPTLEKIRDFTQKNLACLPHKYKNLDKSAHYPVIISPELKRLIHALSRDLR